MSDKLEAAAAAYHNGQPLLMTDAEFDDAVDALREADPSNPFLTKVGAPILLMGEEVTLPIPLPSLNKIKTQEAIDKWTSTAAEYHISHKLDGCSALWFPATKKLYTRGDGTRGRDISAFVPYFKGLANSSADSVTAVRGELIMRSNSPAIPQGKLARNIVAGALNRKEADPALFAEIRFVAYELVGGSKCHYSPGLTYNILQTAGFEVAGASVVPAANLTEAKLSELYSASEAKSAYQIDGIVLAPNVFRPANYRSTEKNPVDRVAWKTRLAIQTATARTTVRGVEWNVSHQGHLIPRVLFDTVTLAGANISAATGLHGRWIYENGIGPGAVIEVRRAGDVIPQIIAVHSRCPSGPAMPAVFLWVSEDSIHIKPAGDEVAAESACIKLTHALKELGAENVGPGVVAKLYAAGFTTIRAIFAASAADFEARVESCKGKMAERIWQGLRTNKDRWTELNFLVASSTMPHSVGHTKLTPLLAMIPDPALWPASVSAFKVKVKAKGISEKTIDEIAAAIPAYLSWKAATGLALSLSPLSPSPPVHSSQTVVHSSQTVVHSSQTVVHSSQKVVVFTGLRSKELETQLVAAGHIIGDTVTKKTTHLVHADGATSSTKITKARALGITILSLSEFLASQ